jgi:hypothetical protein
MAELDGGGSLSGMQLNDLAQLFCIRNRLLTYKPLESCCLQTEPETVCMPLLFMKQGCKLLGRTKQSFKLW